MARVDPKRKAVHAKLVYYGPGLCGKTTNLEVINKKVATGDLMSLATEGDRTIFFDFMPLDLGKVAGMDVKFKLYTVPGQVRYNQTRKMVLKNVDGIVFVADSQRMMSDANLESLDNLFSNLAELGIRQEDVPIVLQYNKRDLSDIMSVQELDAMLNQGRFTSYPASAYTGEGVLETLKGACKVVLTHLMIQLTGQKPAGSDVTSAKATGRTAAAQAEPNSGPSAQKTQRMHTLGKPAAAGSKPTPTKAAVPQAVPAAAPAVVPAPVPAPPAVDLASLQAAIAKLPTKLDVEAAVKTAIQAGLKGVPNVSTPAGGKPTVSAPGIAKADIEAAVKKAVSKLPGKGDLEAVVKAEVAKMPGKAEVSAAVKAEIAKLAGKADVAAAVKAEVARLPGKADLESVVKAELARLPKASGEPAAKAVGAGSAGIGRAELSATVKAELINLPTKAELEAVKQQVAALPTKEELAAVQKQLAEVLSALERVSTIQSQQPAPAAANGGPQEAAAKEAAAKQAAAKEAAAKEAAATEAAAKEAASKEAAGKEAAAKEAAAKEAAAKQAAAKEAAAKEAAAKEAAAKEAAAKQAAAKEAAAKEAAAKEAAVKEAAAKEAAAKEAAAKADAEKEEAAKQEAAAKETAAKPEPAEDPYKDDPRHQNAARVARVMLADLALYHREDVEKGIREGDFHERNEEGLADIKATYESRVPEDVRKERDHLAIAIENLIVKKKKELGLE